MGLFNRKKKDDTVKVINCQPVVKVITEPDNHRPCMVGDRRAIFHRWVNSANPVLPRGVEVTENSRYYQFRRTEALVEYEDGTVARVYPSEVRFVDGGDFGSWDWEVAKNNLQNITKEAL